MLLSSSAHSTSGEYVGFSLTELANLEEERQRGEEIKRARAREQEARSTRGRGSEARRRSRGSPPRLRRRRDELPSEGLEGLLTLDTLSPSLWIRENPQHSFPKWPENYFGRFERNSTLQVCHSGVPGYPERPSRVVNVEAST